MNTNGENNMGQPIGRRTGGGFPPANGGKNFSAAAGYDVKTAYGMNASGVNASPPNGPTSTGNGGIPRSLQVKNKGSQDASGVEHTVNLF